MSVLSHLADTSSKAILSNVEKASIIVSVANLEKKLDDYFGANISSRFKFGSYTRETILPRKIDANSDVDYMVVFKDGTAKPQTYLDRLRKFVETKYGKSEIYQSNPTIVLELSHIRFELVPAIVIYDGYNIPAPASDWQDWMATYPNAFNTSLTEANKRQNFNLKPLIRLAKYWNANSGYVYGSYLLEQYIVQNAYLHTTLKDYVYWFFESIQLNWNEAQWRKDKVSRAKEIIKNTRDYERLGHLDLAEKEIKKLLPPIA